MESFAPHYKPVEHTPQLPSGLYEAKIVKAEYKSFDWGQKIEVIIEIDGHLGAKPNKFDILDEPKKDYPKYPLKDQLEQYNKNMTRFFDNFAIKRGNFSDLNEWIGKEGEVTIHPQGNASGYMEIAPYPLTERELKNRIKKAEEASQKAKQQTEAKENEAPTSLDNFPSDVPY